ncbi:outer membrane beta-barrel protein [Niabella sp. 22666]|uniref:outer membrane beta-barrel protein n=1 Tax=Niabella sp. 22666 TaxID=3453954 RepID=UPI003F834D13
MIKILFLSLAIAISLAAYSQHRKVTIGPELLTSFNHDPSFLGVGGSAQLDIWIKERLWLGVNSGYLHFKSNKGLDGSNTRPGYGAIPVLGVIKYPLPVLKGLYGQDMFGYTFAHDVKFEDNREKAKGGFTYYFALGYEFAEHFDISAKVGRSRFNKKDRPVDVNEHNVGLRLAYLF